MSIKDFEEFDKLAKQQRVENNKESKSQLFIERKRISSNSDTDTLDFKNNNFFEFIDNYSMNMLIVIITMIFGLYLLY